MKYNLIFMVLLSFSTNLLAGVWGAKFSACVPRSKITSDPTLANIK